MISYSVSDVKLGCLCIFVAECFHGADVGERLFGNSVHLRLLLLNGALDSPHTLLIKGCKKNDGNDSSKGDTSEGRGDEAQNDDHSDDEKHATNKHRHISTERVLNDLNVRVQTTDQVTCSFFVEESNVFVDYGIVEVFAEFLGNALTQNVEDSCTKANTNSRNLNGALSA